MNNKINIKKVHKHSLVPWLIREDLRLREREAHCPTLGVLQGWLFQPGFD